MNNHELWLDMNRRSSTFWRGERQKTAHMAAIIDPVIHDCALTAIDPGHPADSEEPKASEGFNTFRDKVQECITGEGWDVLGSNPAPPWDFIIQEIYTDCVICVDLLSGEYYRIPLTIDGAGAVTLADPEQYDLTYTPAQAAPTQEPVSEEKNFTAAARATVMNPSLLFRPVKARLNQDSGEKLPAYDVLLMSSGWTSDGRYFPIEVVQNAVAKKLFDGKPCYFLHQQDDDDDSVGGRPEFPCGMIKTGSVRAIKNDAGEYDVIGTVVMMETDVGKNVNAFIRGCMATGSKELHNSPTLLCQGGPATVDGREALRYDSIEEVVSVDFLYNPAFPRTGVLQSVAAAKQEKPVSDIKELNVDEKQELAELRAKNAELTKANADLAAQTARAAKEKTVDAMLSASNLPANLHPGSKVMLMQLATEQEQKDQLALIVDGFWTGAKTSGPTDSANSDAGTVNVTLAAKHAKEDTNMASFDKACGLRPEFIKKVRDRQLVTA